MNIFRRLFNWVQSGPVDFSYVTGEWGFKKGKTGPGPSDNALREPSILHVPVKLPTKVAAAAAKGRVAARVVIPVTNSAPTVTVFAQATSETHEPVSADLFTPGVITEIEQNCNPGRGH